MAVEYVIVRMQHLWGLIALYLLKGGSSMPTVEPHEGSFMLVLLF